MRISIALKHSVSCVPGLYRRYRRAECSNLNVSGILLGFLTAHHLEKILKHFVVALLCMLVLASCATGKTAALREGLTKTEVLNLIGNPDGFQRSGDYEALHYVDRQINGWFLTNGLNVERVDYSVILKNDRVVQYGRGRFIERSTNEPPFALVRQR